MDPDGDTLQSDELLAQLGWVRALAQRLVADPEVTDDVLQQVCLLALQRAPREAQTGPRLRAWLATATRRMAQHAGRASARRQRRERVAARPEALPSAADVAVHREALRGLVDAVTALEEPAYSVLVARYFEGRSVAEIAAQSGASADAVRQRLSRARQQLRAKLEQLVAEDRSGRLRAVLPLAAVPASLPTAGTPALGHLGGLLVAKALGTGVAKLGIALLLLACLIGGTWYVLHEGQQASHPVAVLGEIPPAADAGAQLPASDLAKAEQLVDAASADSVPAGDSVRTAATYPPGITTYVVSGRVVDEQGLPWAGAVVRSVLDGTTGSRVGVKTWSYDIELDQLPSTTTDEGGRFSLTNPWEPASGFDRIQGLAPEPVVLVEADGMAWHAFPLSNHDGHDRQMGDLVLSMKAAAIVARVVDEAGAPIAGAAAGIWSGGAIEPVRGTPGLPGFQGFNLMGLTRTNSDADGRVEIPRLWPSTCAVSFRDTSHERRTVRDISVGAGQTVDLGDVVLGRGGEIAGVVRNQDGTPVANAEVWATDAGWAYARDIGNPEPDDWGRADPLPAVIDQLHDMRAMNFEGSPVTSDAEGRFTKTGLSTGLSKGMKDVFVEAAGFEPLRVADVAPDSTHLELVLSPETNMDVLVVDDRSGKALAGAALRAFRRSEAFAVARQPVVTERLVTPGAVAGAFVVHTIGRQGTRLVASAPGHATQVVQVTEAAPETPVTVHLGPACAATGRVEDAKGRPVPDASATLRPPAPQPTAEAPAAPPDDDKREARTDAQGVFRFDDLLSGAFTLDVQAAGFVSAPSSTIEVGAGAVQALPTIVLQRACGISGTVSRADGTPAEGLIVWLLSGHITMMCKVDRSGAFALQDVGSGNRTLHVADRLGARSLLELEIMLDSNETRVLSLVLPRSPVLHGLVTSGGVPVADTRLHAIEQPADSNYRAVDVSQPCDADGRVTLQLPLDGSYRLRAERHEGGATAWIDLDAPWGLERSFDFELGSGSIAGRVTDASDGSAPPDIEVSLVREGEPATDWLAAGPAGAFDIPSLLPGDYAIRARSKTYPESGLDVHLDAGQRLADVVVPIALGAVIEGLVVDGHGQPDGAWVCLVTPGDPPTVVQHGAPQGSFHIEGIAPGHYRIVITGDANYADFLLDPQMADVARSSEQASTEIDVRAGEVRRVTLQTGK